MTHLCIDQKGEIIQQLRQKAFARLEEVIGKTLNSTEVTILIEVLKKTGSPVGDNKYSTCEIKPCFSLNINCFML